MCHLQIHAYTQRVRDADQMQSNGYTNYNSLFLRRYCYFARENSQKLKRSSRNQISVNANTWIIFGDAQCKHAGQVSATLFCLMRICQYGVIERRAIAMSRKWFMAFVDVELGHAYYTPVVYYINYLSFVLRNCCTCKTMSTAFGVWKPMGNAEGFKMYTVESFSLKECNFDD